MTTLMQKRIIFSTCLKVNIAAAAIMKKNHYTLLTEFCVSYLKGYISEKLQICISQIIYAGKT